MKSKIANKIISAILSISLILQIGTSVVYAEESNPKQETKIITAFVDLAEDVKNITVPMGTNEEETLKKLPQTVTATVEHTSYEKVTTGSSIADGTHKKTENMELAVTWESDKPFSSETANTFTYTAKLIDGSYMLSEGVAMPQIKVQVNDKQSNESTIMTKKDSMTSRKLTSSNIAPTVDVSYKDIYANGTPITIEKGTLDGAVRKSKIKYNNGISDVYLDLNPNQDGIQQDADLSSYKIYGGSNKDAVEETSITMTGGIVSNIYGGGHSSDVSGDTHINISGTAEVGENIYGGGDGHAVQGTAYITITGGNISGDHAGMISGGGTQWGTVGRAEIKITGGTVNQVMAVAEAGGGNVIGDKTALVTIPVWVNDKEFNNVLYKKDKQWIVKGNVILTDDLSITIAANETMIVQSGSILTTNGKLINNGTIIKKGTITGDISGIGSIVLTPLVDDVNKAIYAKGIPITISKGTGDNESKISYGENLYVDFDGNSSKDLREYSIYGGSNTEEKVNSNIKMTDGSVKNIYGEGKGFIVKDTTIRVTGGTVSGTIEGGGENSTAKGYITVVSNGLKSETFDNLFYKETELKWKIKGEYAILEKESFWLESNETLEIPESAILIIKGEFTNKGIISNNGKIIGVAGGNIQGTGVTLTQPIINEGGKVIYANGTPLIIEKGSDSEHSRIKYYDGTNYIYLKMGSSEDLLIKGYKIDGGAENGEVRKTSITMNGGNITAIEGGNATESVDIIVTGDVTMPVGRDGNISCSNTNENAVSNLFIYYTGDKHEYKPCPIIDSSSDGFKNIFCYYPNMSMTEDKKLEIIQGKAVIPKGYTVEIPTGKEITIPRVSNLTIDGTLTNNGSLLVEESISKKSTGTLQGSGIFKKTVFTADDIQAIPNQLYTGNAIIPTVMVSPTYTFMGKDFTVDTSGYTKSYENNINAGTAKVVFTDKNDNSNKVEKNFNIVKSGTTFEGGIKTYSFSTETNTFNYEDTITVKVTPKATGKIPGTEGATGIFSAPTDNKMALYVGDTKIAEGNADVNGVYTMIYDTKGKALKIGDNTITAKYVGNSNIADYSENVTVTLNKKAITSAVVNTSDASASKKYDGTSSFTNVALTTLEGVESGDTVQATADGTVSDANVGIDKDFTATSVILDGDHKDYYSLDKGKVSGKVSITQAAITGVNQELQVVKGLEKEYIFDLTKLLPALSEGKSFGYNSYTVGTVTDTNNVLAQNPTSRNIKDGKITLKVVNVADKDKTAKVQIKVSSKNYKDFTADLNVKTIDKTPLTIEAAFTGGTYNGKPYAYTGTPTFKNCTETVSGITYTAKYEGRDGTSYDESETAPKNAGKYNLIIAVSGESANTYAGTATIGFEITKKQITAKPKDVSMESNGSFPVYKWEIETGIAGETITVANISNIVMEAQENGVKLTAVKVGTFNIVFTTAPIFNQNGETEKNYDIQIGKGKMTVTQHNSGGGSSSGGGYPTPDKPKSDYVNDNAIIKTSTDVKIDLTKGSTKVSSDQMDSLINENKEKPVIVSGENYSVTFQKGTMKHVDGKTDFDFKVNFNTGENYNKINEISKGNLALMVNYNYSGDLPGEASIRINVGTKYSGQILDYYYYNQAKGKLEFMQSATVDDKGFVTVKQTHCSDYALIPADISIVKDDVLPRIGGLDRYETSALISRAGWNIADTVVLARSDNYVDALAGTPLAYKLNAPILLTETEKLNKKTSAEIKRLGAKKAVLLGGIGAISEEVEKALTDMGLTIERISGNDRFETAELIAKKVSPQGAETAVVVYGMNFPDALSVSSYAAANGMPILLTDTHTISKETLDAIKELKVKKIIVVGGSGVIGEDVLSKLPDAKRLWGNNRYDTCMKVASYFKFNTKQMYIATGLEFADAVAGGVLAAKQNTGILLVDGKDTKENILPYGLNELIQDKGITGVTILGGSGAVNYSTSVKLKELLK